MGEPRNRRSASLPQRHQRQFLRKTATRAVPTPLNAMKGTRTPNAMAMLRAGIRTLLSKTAAAVAVSGDTSTTKRLTNATKFQTRLHTKYQESTIGGPYLCLCIVCSLLFDV